MSRVAPLFVLALALCLSAGCNDDDDSPPQGDGSVVSDGSTADQNDPMKRDGASGTPCLPSTFEEQVVSFCQTQFPSPPAAGELGASCVDDNQCDTGSCLEPYGSSAYCSIPCPQGDECPVSFSCQDSGSSGPMCYQEICIYGGSDKADCVSRLNAEIELACRADCQSQLSAWLSCLLDAGRICSEVQADDTCGVESGLLDSCCPSCQLDY